MSREFEHQRGADFGSPRLPPPPLVQPPAQEEARDQSAGEDLVDVSSLLRIIRNLRKEKQALKKIVEEQNEYIAQLEPQFADMAKELNKCVLLAAELHAE